MADDQQTNVPLLEDSTAIILQPRDQSCEDIVTRVWIESKKLWLIVGPAIFSRISTYSVLVISQAFAGHLGDLDLAAISIALNVIIGFDLGLMVPNQQTFYPISTLFISVRFLLCLNSVFVYLRLEWQAR